MKHSVLLNIFCEKCMLITKASITVTITCILRLPVKSSEKLHSLLLSDTTSLRFALVSDCSDLLCMGSACRDAVIATVHVRILE